MALAKEHSSLEAFSRKTLTQGYERVLDGLWRDLQMLKHTLTKRDARSRHAAQRIIQVMEERLNSAAVNGKRSKRTG